MKISNIRHEWPEIAGFLLERKQGHAEYTFLHFFGCVDLQINGKIIRTRPHACILFAPGTPQWFYSPTPLIHDWFHFSADVPPTNMACDTLYYPPETAYISEIVREIELELSTQKSAFEQLVALKAEELFIKIGRSAAEDAVVTSSTVAKRLQQLRRKMFLHLEENWTTERMAKAVQLSPSRFYATYRSCFGRSPTDDLICARMEAAQTALAFSDEPLEELAVRLGYANITHFHRQFHKRVGVSPLAYRHGKRWVDGHEVTI